MLAPPRSPTESVGVCLGSRSLMRGDQRQDRSRVPTTQTRLEWVGGNLGDNEIVAAAELAEFMMPSGLRGPMPRNLPERRGTERDAVGAAAVRNRCEYQSLYSNV